MNKNEQELNSKLAEWAGFKHKVGALYEYPNEDYLGERPLPNFPQSLDACFEWLVPNIPNLESISFVRRRGDWIGQFYYLSKEKPQVKVAIAETPALAFCLAIEKLIDTEREVQWQTSTKNK